MTATKAPHPSPELPTREVCTLQQRAALPSATGESPGTDAQSQHNHTLTQRRSPQGSSSRERAAILGENVTSAPAPPPCVRTRLALRMRSLGAWEGIVPSDPNAPSRRQTQLTQKPPSSERWMESCILRSSVTTPG
ncbi:hypothetical protein R6Z07F_014823 [Ovis aries]